MKKTTTTKTAKKTAKATPKSKKAATVQSVEIATVQPIETVKTETISKSKANYLHLISISEQARKIKETLIEGAETAKQKAYFMARPLNYFILTCVYFGATTQFKTFEEWQKEGASINKGEKAFLIWGQPVERETATDDQATEKMLHYPISYVFSRQQVTMKHAAI